MSGHKIWICDGWLDFAQTINRYLCMCAYMLALPMWHVFVCLCLWVSGCLNKDIIGLSRKGSGWKWMKVNGKCWPRICNWASLQLDHRIDCSRTPSPTPPPPQPPRNQELDWIHEVKKIFFFFLLRKLIENGDLSRWESPSVGPDANPSSYII